MAKMNSLFVIAAIAILSGCASSTPYGDSGSSSLEQVLIEHAEKVQRLSDSDDGKKQITTDGNTQHLEQMYREWQKLKPQLEELLASKHQEEQKPSTEKVENQNSKTLLEQGTRKVYTATTSDSKAKASVSYGVKPKYNLQIGATNSKSSADKFWLRQKVKYTELLTNIDVKIEQAVKAGKNIYRIKIGQFDAYKKADKFCNEFQALGGQCIIKKI